MRIKKLAGGGLPAFVSYVNVEQALPAYAGIGSSSASAESTSSSKSSSSSKSGSSSDIGLLNKEMQKILMENGLPSDVQYFLQKADVFGNSIDPLDPHSQERIYTKLLSMLPEIKQNKAEYDDAIQHAREKGTLDQVAVTKDGYIYVLNKETGQLDRKAPNVELDSSKFEKLTNGQLLQMRAYVPGYAMDKGDFTTLVASSISFADIEKSITDKIDKLGKTTNSQEGYIRKDSKAVQAMQGYEKLIEQSEDGVYKLSTKDVTQNAQVKAFLSYITKSLSNQEKGVLLNRAAENGASLNEMIVELIQGRISEEHDIKIDYDKQATNGANTDKDGNKKQLQQTPLMNYFQGNGGVESKVNLSPGKAHALTITAMDFNTPNKINGSGLVEASSFDKFLTDSGIASISNASNGVYVGDQFIDSAHFNRLIYSGGNLRRAWLPVTQDEHGQFKPNLDIIEQYEQALQDLHGNTDPQYIQQYLNSHGLSEYFVLTNEGLQPNPQTTRAFFMVDVFGDGDSDWFGSGHSGVFDPDDSQYITKVENLGINEDDLENRIRNILGKDVNGKSVKYKKEGHLYSGIAFIPIQGTAQQAATASGQLANSYVPTNLLDQMSRDASNQFKQTSKSVLSDG